MVSAAFCGSGLARDLAPVHEHEMITLDAPRDRHYVCRRGSEGGRNVIPHRRRRPRFGSSASIGLCIALAALLPTVATAAPLQMSFYCSANSPQAKTEYMTRIFSAAADKRDVISAWRQYLEDKHIEVGRALSCDAGVKDEDVKRLQDVSRASIASIQWRIVDVDWTFSGQVPASQQNMVYGYCQSGTSVANATYFSDVFGLTLAQVTPNAFVPAFFDDIRAKYGNPPGLASGTGPGPNGEWCAWVGNIADAERDKKAREDQLREPAVPQDHRAHPR